MSNERIQFSKQDIGGEILPILTSGLYRDTLDALREYIQNAIDAKCTSIKIAISQDVITIIDDGVGMTGDAAKKAMRLGISDKNPKTHVGFRGIGIYSSFHLCELLEIFTKSDYDSNTYKISFDFMKIRNDLLVERELRKGGNPPSLYLEKLLEKSVRVEVENDFILTQHGTTVVMNGLLPETYSRLNDRDQVVNYLQNVVPLPFNPDFKWKHDVESKFVEYGFTFTPVNLQMGLLNEDLYRPYTNEIFKNKGKYQPIFYEMSDSKQSYGFVWYCVNDARATLKDENIRGILIKAKGGFSIGDRKYLEPYFGRPVVSRRVTGEMIITNDNLVPNAARSDFENNSTRQGFLETLPKAIHEIDRTVNDIQEKERAREILIEDIIPSLELINGELISSQRDRDRLLHFYSILDNLSRMLEARKTLLSEIEPEKLKRAFDFLIGCQKFVMEALDNEKKSREKIEKEIVETVQRKAEQSPDTGKDRSEKTVSLLDLVDDLGITEVNSLRRILEYLDNFLKENLKREEYIDLLSELRSYLEENS